MLRRELIRPSATASAATTVSTTATPTHAPSPAESTGCTIHEDHWHCEGLRTGFTAATTHTPVIDDFTSTVKKDSSATTTTSAQTTNSSGAAQETNAAGRVAWGMQAAAAGVAGAVAVVML